MRSWPGFSIECNRRGLAGQGNLEKVKVTRTVTKTVDGVEQRWKRPSRRREARCAGLPGGCLSPVFDAKGHGPVVIRMKTVNRTDQVELPSLTPIWRSAEFQEREIFDLFGIVFTGHPDLRRLLMWDEFKDHPMRRDYVEPDDFEYEPTAHDEVLKRAQAHRGREQGIGTKGGNRAGWLLRRTRRRRQGGLESAAGD
jgi:NADH-quinone oxidoreductase subunit C